MVDAYNLLMKWKQNPMNYMCMVDGSVDGMMFVTDGDDDKDKSRKTASGFMGRCWTWWMDQWMA
jgi:hypothetical protein